MKLVPTSSTTYLHAQLFAVLPTFYTRVEVDVTRSNATSKEGILSKEVGVTLAAQGMCTGMLKTPSQRFHSTYFSDASNAQIGNESLLAQSHISMGAALKS